MRGICCVTINIKPQMMDKLQMNNQVVLETAKMMIERILERLSCVNDASSFEKTKATRHTLRLKTN